VGEEARPREDDDRGALELAHQAVHLLIP
jgi:hypothetical protein